MIKWVLDTSVVVAAMRSPKGASAALLRAAYQQKFLMLQSVPLALEYESVCSRPEHWQSAGITQAEANLFVGAVIGMATPVEITYLWRPKLKDPNDDMVLEVAVNGGADGIVTFNQADFLPTILDFGIQVLLPREAIQQVRS